MCSGGSTKTLSPRKGTKSRSRNGEKLLTGTTGVERKVQGNPNDYTKRPETSKEGSKKREEKEEGEGVRHGTRWRYHLSK